MPQYSYGAQPRFTLGQEATLSPCSKDSYLNPLLPQIDTVAFAGGGSGDYTILIRGEEGDFPVTVNAAPATAADFVTAFDADPDLVNRTLKMQVLQGRNISHDTPTDSTAVLINVAIMRGDIR